MDPDLAPLGEVHLGTPVVCPDGRAGSVAGVVVDPRRQTVTHLVVRAARELRGDVVVPLDLVEEVSPTYVRLRPTVAETADQAPYAPELYVSPHPRWRPPAGYAPPRTLDGARLALPGAPASGAGADAAIGGIAAGVRVTGHDGPVGTVLRTLLPPEPDAPAHLVVKVPERRRGLALPWAWVVSAGAHEVVVDAGRAQVERLPEVRGDAELRRAVEEALWRDALVGRADLPAFRVEVEGGQVTLTGHLDSGPVARSAVATARLVPGVLDVRNAVVADDDLEVTVARWLADDPRTRHFPIQVYVHAGVIELSGTVDSAAARLAAEAVAARAPSRAVVDGLSVPGEPPVRLPVLLPRTGGPVFATDGRVGHVVQVVIAPETRRVAALVVATPADNGLVLSGAPLHLVPSDLIGQVADAVWLRTDRATVEALPAPEAAAFTAPPLGWAPPVDYRRSDVLFPRSDSGSGLRPRRAGRRRQPAAPSGVGGAPDSDRASRQVRMKARRRGPPSR
jgi:osmotically-inducible protein OsmY/sporulation protein YlmC with PRC-barrel domain